MTRFLLSVLALTLCSPAHAGEEYFLLMFGSQRMPPNPNYSHTFATFVKVTWEGDGPCPRDPNIESHTISWLPSNQILRTWALHPECGRNFNLHDTFDYTCRTEQRVSMWGPYPIQKELYCRALQRKAQLEGGTVRYKVVDAIYSNDKVSNCIHAVAVISGGPRQRGISVGFGELASYFVLLQLDRWILSDQPACWLRNALGLDRYSIIDRDDPRNHGAFGTFRRVLARGSESVSP